MENKQCWGCYFFFVFPDIYYCLLHEDPAHLRDLACNEWMREKNSFLENKLEGLQ